MNPDNYTKIVRSYEQHPLTAASILQRVKRSRGSLAGMTEIDLAEDNECLLTDQNHLGGADAMRELVRELELQSGEKVLDVGSGLGGPLRVLAHELGCRCHGVELTRIRYEDAIELTKLVALDHLVTFTLGDFLQFDTSAGPYDFVLGLGSFNHFPDLIELLSQCRRCLPAGGRLYVGDAYLLRAVGGESEQQALVALCDRWNGKIRSRPQWQAALEQAGFTQQAWRDKSQAQDESLDYFLEAHRSGRMGQVAQPEVEAWELALDLSGRGLLSYFSLVAKAA